MTAVNETSRHAVSRLEDELLLCCARAALDAQAAERIRALAGRDIDWSYLCWSAEVHGVLPMLYWHLDACCPELLPRATRESLENYYRENARRTVDAIAWIVKMLQLLSEAGIQAVPARGPSLAATLYPRVGLRQLSEIELLVREPDFSDAKELLCAHGCSPSFSSPGATTARERIFAKTNRGVVLGTWEVTAPVHLRYAITPMNFALPFDFERVWRRLKPLSLSGETVLVPSAEDLILFLCLDGAQHLWKQLVTLCDLAELIGSHDHKDWNRLLEIARGEGSSSVLCLGLALAVKRFGAKLPPDIAQAVRSNERASAMAVEMNARPFTTARRLPGIAERLRFHLPLRERFWDKVQHCIALTTPGPIDAPAIPTPPLLDFLYYFLRPFRYVVEQVKHLRHARPDRPQWSATPPEIVDRMLRLAGVGRGDEVYDLGCGEGRIVIHAARHYGARGVGVDVDEVRVAESRAHADREGVQDLVRFERRDAFDVDLRSATVVALSMTVPWNDGIAPKLRNELPPAARIVSWNTDFAEWPPQKVEIVRVGSDVCRIYMWEIDRHRRNQDVVLR